MQKGRIVVDYRYHIRTKGARIRANRRCFSFRERLTSIYSGRFEAFSAEVSGTGVYRLIGLFTGSVNMIEETGFERDLVSFYWRDVEFPSGIAAKQERESLIGRLAVKRLPGC